MYAWQADRQTAQLKEILRLMMIPSNNAFDITGTTSMNALSAHLCANAAHIEAGQTVLDPFCGTGSLLSSAAHLGAEVVGSDIDADCLGRRRIHSDPSSSSSSSVASSSSSPSIIARSKNARFKRKNGESQLDKSSRDNFVFYNLEHKLLDLIGVDASRWMIGDDDDGTRDYSDSGASDEECDGRLDSEALVGEMMLMKKYDKVRQQRSD
jgi:hypothetical protein